MNAYPLTLAAQFVAPALVLASLGHYGAAHAMPVAWQVPFALAWGLVLLQALEGLGGLVHRVAHGRAGCWGLHAALGMAALLLVAGWLNWFRVLHAGVLQSLLWGGVLAGLAARVRRPHSAPRRDGAQPSALSLLWVAAVVAVSWRYLQSAAWPQFNGHDDFHAYFAYPKKLLELGWLGTDPYSERRLVSGYGGQSVLLAALGLQLPERFWHLFDPGGALIITAALLLRPVGNNVSWESRALATLSVLAMALATPGSLNVTSDYGLMPLVVALVVVMLRAAVPAAGRDTRALAADMALASLLGASACVLKNSFLPFIGLLAFGIFGLWILGGREVRLRLALPACVAGVTLLLPWMLDLHRSSGTLSYPLLGRGFHGSVYGHFPVANAGFLGPGRIGHSVNSLVLAMMQMLFIVQMAALAWGVSAWRTAGAPARLVALISGASMLTLLALWAATGGYAADRYASPALVAALAAEVILVQAAWPRLAAHVRLALLCAACALVGHGWHQFEEQLRPGVAALRRSLAGTGPYSEDDSAAYKRLNAALPRDGAVISRVAMPFLLAPRADLFIADYPEGASPPPGMPSGGDAEALAGYLLRRGVRYAIWDHGREANFPRTSFSDRLGPGEHPWIRGEAEATFAFQDRLEALRRSRRVTYDQDGLAVIDLAQPATH